MAVESTTIPRPSHWARSYPPLVLLAVAVLVAAFILPSSLNLPQSNPSTVLEYAPVPPEDDEPPPPSDGNTSSLGLGSSSSLTEGAAPTPPPPPPPPGQTGASTTAQDLRCYGDPPRQSEDPMSPPCVPFFQGDNGGATYQGVTGNEITIVYYFDRGVYGRVGQGAGELAPPAGEWIDGWAPPKPPCPSDRQSNDPDQCDHVLVRVVKALTHQFNSTWQTYGRRVHPWIVFTSSNTEALRKKDAADHWSQKKPFAVINDATFFGYTQAYLDAMAARSVVGFSQQSGLRNDFYRKYPAMVWGFWPDIEHWADLYATYVCDKIDPHPVEYYGNPQGQGSPNGDKRRIGLFYTTDEAEPGLQYFASLIKEKINPQDGTMCRANIVEEATFPKSGYAVDNSDPGADQTQAVAQFKGTDASNPDVTTVLYLGGVEGKFTQAADAQGYYPEIVVAGDLENDNNFIGTVQNQKVWRNAWAMTYHIRLNRLEDTPGYKAYKEAYPQGPADRDGVYARDMYRDIFMLYQSIQVAGPRLTPHNIDEGFHAIPEKQSTDPYIASCFFDPGDYTCVKDAAEQWWDTSSTPPGGTQPGCWRMVRGGRRFLAGNWPGANDVFKPDQFESPCTGYGGSIQIRPA